MDEATLWDVRVERVEHTGHSVISYGFRGETPVVLKVVRPGAEEERQGEVLAAFAGRGAVRVLELRPGAVLMERACPGSPLREQVLQERDEEATAVLAATMRSLGQEHVPPGLPAVDALAEGFDLPRGPVPGELVRSAHRRFSELCASQTRVRLLHGDLHHDNVLLDTARGWLAIDPKGWLGELEYEAGALFRNPWDRPEIFTDPVRIRARLACLECELPVDLRRVRSWAFAQAVLAALWGVEDGLPESALGGWVALARTLQELPV